MVSLPEFWILVYESVRVVAQLFGIFRTIQFSLFFQMAQEPNIVFGDHGAATAALLSMSQLSEVFPGSNLFYAKVILENNKRPADNPLVTRLQFKEMCAVMEIFSITGLGMLSVLEPVETVKY